MILLIAHYSRKNRKNKKPAAQGHGFLQRFLRSSGAQTPSAPLRNGARRAADLRGKGAGEKSCPRTKKERKKEQKKLAI
jgi:hypothetical protein